MDPTRIAEDDLKVGRRVFAKLTKRPDYRPATVTERNNRMIRVEFDDGGELTTTINFIRVPPSEVKRKETAVPKEWPNRTDDGGQSRGTGLQTRESGRVGQIDDGSGEPFHVLSRIPDRR